MEIGRYYSIRIVETGVFGSTSLGSTNQYYRKSSLCFNSGKVICESTVQIVVPSNFASQTRNQRYQSFCRQLNSCFTWTMLALISLRRIIFIYNLIITKMRSTGVNRGQIWLRKCNQKSKTTNLTTDIDFDELGVLRKQAKRISILTRMQERSKTKESLKPKVRPMSSVQRISSKRGDLSFKAVQKQYQQEKSLVREVLQKTAVERQKEEGLLGQIQRYESMGKQQLIQKLISLEHLANTIFKRNKYLQEELLRVKLQKQF